MENVSVIGCGFMGSAMIQTLAKNNIPVTIWNRTPEKARALAQPGVTVAESFSDAFDASPVIMFVIADMDYSVTHSLLESKKEGLEGKMVVQFSSGGGEGAQNLKSFVESSGGRYLDGVISVEPKEVGNPDSAFFYAGHASVLERIRPVLQVFGEKISFVGDDLNKLSMVEFAIGILTGLNDMALFYVHEMFQRQNIPLELLGTVLNHSVIPFLSGKAKSLDLEKAYLTVNVMAEGSKAMSEVMGSMSIDTSLFDAMAKIFEPGVASGRGEEDVYAYLRDLPSSESDSA